MDCTASQTCGRRCALGRRPARVFGVRALPHLALLLAVLALAACQEGDPSPIVVDRLDDTASPDEGVTLRSALAAAQSGQPIVFAPSLDGGTIALSIVGEPRTILPGEVMGIRIDPSGPISYLVGYFDRDYGASALFARKDVVIDASSLASGITLEWTGGDALPARVLAVRGDLTLRNVTVTGGVNLAEDISTADPDDQPWSLARGGGVAVWGAATLEGCEIRGNRVEGDFDASRDRGAFGGGVYANIVRMRGCVVSGNSVLGGGAAGGGVFSVGGAKSSRSLSTIEHSSITGNRIAGIFAYGAGVYSDGGGIGNSKTLSIENTTIARNLVEPPPGLPGFLLGMGYWRGGAVYMSNGSLRIKASTLALNEVHGVPRTDDLDKPNLAGGVAATIGNAHAVEQMLVGHSIIAGNTVHEIGGETYAQDVFTGSLFSFHSMGFNRLGDVDFAQMLVPVGEPGWYSLSRRHYPQPGDEDGVDVADVLDLEGATVSTTALSDGVDAGEFAVLHYPPQGTALDQVPADTYGIHEVEADYDVTGGATDDFLEIVLGRVEDLYGLTGFANDFTLGFEAFLMAVDLDEETAGNQPYETPGGAPILTLADTAWFGPAQTWPAQLANHPYIHFWHRLDAALQEAGIPGMGPETLGDDAWAALFSPGPLAENPDIVIWMVDRLAFVVRLEALDQLGADRPAGANGDIGAIEVP